jgi:hypothetical protein
MLFQYPFHPSIGNVVLGIVLLPGKNQRRDIPIHKEFFVQLQSPSPPPTNHEVIWL